MNQSVIVVARQVGQDYRGEVLDGRDYRVLLITAHLYPNETIAKTAARRMWADAQHHQEQTA